jgi:trehalose 6-phosphate phosphatase
LIEHKPGSLALHWRGLPDQEVADIRDRVLMGWLPIAENSYLTLQHFDGGVEIRIAERNKGDAVRAILAELDVDAPVAYLGDDDTDEDAFRALQDRGLRVLVRPHWRETAADLWLRPPAQLLAFLSDWLKACGQSTSHLRVRLA